MPKTGHSPPNMSGFCVAVKSTQLRAMQTTASPASRSPPKCAAERGGGISKPCATGFWGRAVLCPSKVELVLSVLESGQLSVKEEKGIRNKSNSLSSLISEAVYLQVFLQVLFPFSTNLQWRGEICSMVTPRESCRTLSSQGQEVTHVLFFKAASPPPIRSAVMQGKGPWTGPEASLVVGNCHGLQHVVAYDQSSLK